MKIKCKHCGEVIEGDKKGTYITCKCGKIAIDETEYYWRINGNREDFEEVKTIKIITLFNMIAHNVDVPEKILTLNEIWIFDKISKKYKNKHFQDLFKILEHELLFDSFLNFEVDIVSEEVNNE